MILDIIIPVITAFAVWLFSNFCFKCLIEKNSESHEPVTAFGKQYFFMTQVQIQNAVKAIILLEKNENGGS